MDMEEVMRQQQDVYHTASPPGPGQEGKRTNVLQNVIVRIYNKIYMVACVCVGGGGVGSY